MLWSNKNFLYGGEAMQEPKIKFSHLAEKKSLSHMLSPLNIVNILLLTIHINAYLAMILKKIWKFDSTIRRF